MTYRQFRTTVQRMTAEIPEGFLRDLQGVHALEQEVLEEGYDDVWRMGEYLDPGPDAFLGGDAGLGRHVALYWGSFRAIAENDPDFDWEEEIWETLTHELQHHVESLAGDGRLIEQDLLDAQQFDARSEPADAAPTDLDRPDTDAAGDSAGRPWWRRLLGRGS